jgi:hypothetical protein
MFEDPSLWVANYGYNAGGWRVDRHPRTLADVNGDGLEDVVGFGNAGVYVSLSSGDDFAAPSLWVASYGYDAGGWRVNRHPREVVDVDGDGDADIVGFGNAGVYVSLSTGSGYTSPALWVANYGYSAGGWRVTKHPRELADVNGDGKQDIVGFGDAGAYVSLNTGSSFTAPALWVANYGYGAGGWRVAKHPRELADVNGDGKEDIVGFGDAGAYVSLSTGSGFTAPALWVANYGYSAGGWRVNRHPREVVDVNDDGKADIVGFGNAGVYVSLSTGSGFTAPALWVDNFGWDDGWRVNKHPRYLADVNGDDFLDVVGFGDAGVYVSINLDGEDFDDPELWVDSYGYNAGGWRVGKHPRDLADVNGDGSYDVVGFGNAGVYVSPSEDIFNFV